MSLFVHNKRRRNDNNVLLLHRILLLSVAVLAGIQNVGAIKSSSSSSSKIKENLISVYSELQYLVIPQNETKMSTVDAAAAATHVTIGQLRAMPVERLQTLVSQAYGQLQCSYVHTAKAYMHTMQTFLADQMSIVRASAGRDFTLSFGDEAALVLSAMHNNQDMLKTAGRTAYDVMCIFYVYALRIEAHVAKVLNNGDHDSGVILSDYEYVWQLLEKYLDGTECRGFRSANGWDVVFEPGGGGGGGGGCLDQLAVRMVDAVRAVKSSVRRQIHENSKHLMPARGQENFSLDVLSLSNAQTVFGAMAEHFHSDRQFGMIEKALKCKRQEGVELDGVSVHRQVSSLTVFQSGFVQLIKAAVLRMLLSYSLYVKNCGLLDVKSIAKTTKWNKTIRGHLVSYANLLHLDGNDEISAAGKLLGSANVFTECRVRNRLEDSLKSISLKIYNKLGVNFDLSIMSSSDHKLKNIHTADECPSMSVLIKTKIAKISGLLALLRTSLANTDFSVIQSFVPVISNVQGRLQNFMRHTY